MAGSSLLFLVLWCGHITHTPCGQQWNKGISVAVGGEQFGHAHCQWSIVDVLIDGWLCRFVQLTLQFPPEGRQQAANSQRLLHIVFPLFSGLGISCWWFCFLVIWPKGHEFVMRSPGQQIEVPRAQLMALMQLRFLGKKYLSPPWSSIWQLNSCPLWFDGFY